MALQKKRSMITKNGIEVDGDIYTCSLAIREQWFAKVLETGPIEIDFYLDPLSRNEGVLVLNVGYEGCFRVEHAKISDEQQANYFEKLEEMKIAYLKKKKSRNWKGRGKWKNY